MNNKPTFRILGLILAVIMATGMASCSNEDEPFDPDKPYNQKNTLKKVFKNGYLKKRITFEKDYITNNYGTHSYTKEPIEEEFIIDGNNNLVKVLVNDEERALLDYGYFEDPMGNGYHVKYTYIKEGKETVSLCRLNKEGMMVDRYISDGTGRFYEYENGHIAKITDYKVVDGEKIEDDVAAIYEWDSDVLVKYNSLSTGNGGKSYLYGNAGALFDINMDLFPGTEQYLYMAALMGQPSKKVPYGYKTKYSERNITDIKFSSNRLPEYVQLEEEYFVGSHSNTYYYDVKYVWRDL